MIPDDAPGPEQEALIADSVGLALFVVLETLSPPERLAFVLHDMFAVPFDEIAPIIDRHRRPRASSRAARGAGYRARRPTRMPTCHTSARSSMHFSLAARTGDFDALVAVLDPDVVFRIDAGVGSPLARPPVSGAAAVAEQILARGTRFAPHARPAIVNGAAGVVVGAGRRPFAVGGFTVARGRIVEIDLIIDPEKLRGIVFVS